MYFLLLCLFSLLILILQATLFDLLFLGKISLELSLLLVIYAGFHLNITRGGALALIVGFFYDSMASIIPGIFVFIYILVFFIAKVTSDKVRAEDTVFIMGFTFMCALLEGGIIFFIYKALLDINLSYMLFINVFLPQALIVSVISPVFFPLFHRVEVLLSAREPR